MENWLDFIITILSMMAVELPLLFIIIRFILKNRYDSDAMIFSGAIATSMTVPYLWYVIPMFVNTSANYYLYVSWAIVILIEALVFSNALRMSLSRAIIISAAVNIASFFFFPQVKAFIVGNL